MTTTAVQMYNGLGWPKNKESFQMKKPFAQKPQNIVDFSIGPPIIQGCLANSYGANSYDLANSYGFSGKNLNSFIMIFSTFYRLPTRKFK